MVQRQASGGRLQEGGFRREGSGGRVQEKGFSREGSGGRLQEGGFSRDACNLDGVVEALRVEMATISGFTFQVLSSGFRFQGFALRVEARNLFGACSGFRFRVSGFEFRVSGFGFRVFGFGFQISGFGFRGVGIRVEGSLPVRPS